MPNGPQSIKYRQEFVKGFFENSRLSLARGIDQKTFGK